MEDLSSVPRALVLLQGTGHLQIHLGQVIAGGTNSLFKEVEEWSNQDSFMRPSRFQEDHSCSVAAQQTMVNPGSRRAEWWPHTHPISLSSTGLGQGAELSPERHLH